MSNLPANSITTLLSHCKSYLAEKKLSLNSRKLYLADIKRFLTSLPADSITPSTLSSPNLYQDYLKKLHSNDLSPSMLKRTTASLRQLGQIIDSLYSLGNPTSSLSTSSPKLTAKSQKLTTNNKIKHFTNYLKQEQLSSSTIKSYKSDITRYIKWIHQSHPSTKIDQLLKEKNIKKYLNHLSKSREYPTSTCTRKRASLTRFQSWYLSSCPSTKLSDKIKSTLSTSLTRLSPEVTNSPQSGFHTSLITARQPAFSWSTTLSLGLILLLTTSLAIFGYRAFSQDQVLLSQAYPSTPVTPNRQLSFQGRLEDSGGTPITTSTNLIFKLFDATTVGSELYSTGTCAITPDSDGVFSTQIGSTCGSGITSSVFSENADVWLEVTVASETLDPRQQIATVAYALNSETLQGIPLSSTMSAIANSVVPMNSGGEIIIGEQSPTMRAVSGTFAISAPALSITTTSGSSGNISIAPDGTGQVNLLGNTTSTNFFNVSNAQLTTGSLITGTVANSNTGYKLLDLLSGTSPTSVFSVADDGDTTITGDLTITGDDLFMNTNTTNYFLMADGTNYNPVAPASAVTGLGLDAGGAGDIWVEKGGDTMTGQLLIDLGSNTEGIVIQGDASQTANLLEIQDSSSNVLSGVDERGILFSNGGLDIRSTFIGNDAGNINATGLFNTGFGAGAGKSITTANNNAFFGDSAGDSVTEGNSNTAVGFNSLAAVTTATDNVAIGTSALDVNTGSSNTAIGSGALGANIGGTSNVSMGLNSSWGNTTGSNNVAIGTSAMFRSSGGSGNTILGGSAGQGAVGASFSNNTILGYQAGVGLDTGGSNTFLGYQAGYRQTTNSNLLIIDNQVRASAAEELTNSILYGVMASAPASQTLRINAQPSINGAYTLPIVDGTTNYVLTTDGAGTASWVEAAAGVTADSLDYIDFEDTMDLDANLILNQGSYTWTQNFTGTTTDGYTYNANSLTSGTALALASTATAFTGDLQSITLSGSNAANTGSLLAIDNTGVLNTNTSLYIKHYATGTNNLAFRVDDESGDTTPFVIDGNGNVGIGDANPASMFTVGSGDLFQINSSGIIVEIDDVAHTIDDVSGDLTLTSNSASVDIADNLAITGDLTITGDDLFMNTNTTNYFLMADGTNYNPITPVAAVTGLGLDAGGAGDIWVEKGGDTMTGQLLVDLGSDTQGIVIQGDASQTANLQEWQNSGASVLSNISSTGVADLAGLTVNSAYTLPTADGTEDYVLQTDGVGGVTWASADTGIATNSLDYIDFEDTMDLDANLILNQGSYTWTQNFTGTTTDGYTYNANSLTSGTGIALASTATAFTGDLQSITLSGSHADNTGSLLAIDNTGVLNTNTSLYIKHYATGTGNLAFRVDDESGDTTPFVIDGAGNVGIGDSSPSSKLSIGGATSSISNTSGDITIDSASDYISFSGDSIGNMLDLSISGQAGIGIASPVSKLHVTGAVTGKALAIFDETGDQDIIVASASGATRFRVATDGDVYAQSFVDTSSSSFYLDPANTDNSLVIDGDIELNTGGTIASTSNNDIIIDAGSGTVSIGSSGTGKLDAGTIDPPYSINGDKFATYLSGMTGVKEETTGTITTSEYIPEYGYRATLNLATAPQGSDLWLFREITNLHEQFDSLVVLLSASTNTRTWYNLHPNSGIVEIYSTQPSVIGYRLTAPRFDAETWTNTRDSASLGFILEGQTNWDQVSTPDLPTPNAFTEIIHSLTATIAQITSLETNLISPLDDSQPLTITTNTIITPQNPSLPTLTIDGEIQASSISARIARLEELDVDTLRANNIIANSITAGSIEGLDAKIASLSAGSTAELSDDDLETITDRIKARLADLSGATAEDLSTPPESTSSPSRGDTMLSPTPIASDSAILASLDADMVFINDYLAVIGSATITNLDITGYFYTNSITSKSNTLALQPNGGLINLADNTLIVDSSGQVMINGNLTVSGQILADSGSFNSLSLGSPSLISNLSSTSSATALGQLLSVYNEQGEAVATIDASGSASFRDLSTQLITIATPSDATQSASTSALATAMGATSTSNATAGESTLITPNTELTIESPFVTPNTLVYLTPVSNTQNKVLFVSAKETCPPPPEDVTMVIQPCTRSFTVAVNSPANTDIQFNWWIIELAPSNNEEES